MSNKFSRSLICAVFLAASLALSGCGAGNSSSNNNNNGGGGGNQQAGNTVPISVNAGPVPGTPQANIPYVSVTVCVPGSSNCQTIPDVQLDTGSEGLRLVSSVLTLKLPQEIDAARNPLGECAQFLASFTWGPAEMADVSLGSEVASNIPIQVIGGGGSLFAKPPSSCSSSGSPGAQTVADLGANGILGIGPFRQDCGFGCTIAAGTKNPGFYYSCPPTGCIQSSAELTQQLQNPVWMFSGDNNGTIIEMPSIPASGAVSANGTLIFGIGTQSNNGLGSATLFTLDNSGNFTTTFKGTAYSNSFIDSGSNGLYFLDSSTTGIPTCAKPNTSFYCPASPINLSASNTGLNGAKNTVQFTVANADQLNGSFTAFPDLAGTQPSSFDWGLPFFYGRNVFTGIEGQSTPTGAVGPFFAY